MDYTFGELKKYAKKELTGSKAPKIKVALLADSASQFLREALRGIGVVNNIDYEIWEADYGQIERQILDPQSEYYYFKPNYTLILRSTEHLLNQFYKSDLAGREGFAKRQLENFEQLIEQIASASQSKVIINTYNEINDFVFGNCSGKIRSSFIYQLRTLNLGLMHTAEAHKQLFLVDIASLFAYWGYRNAFDTKMYVNADMVYNLEILPHIANNIHAVIQSLNGQFKKCLILDLDNTTWGGIIGDDGMDGIEIGYLGMGKAFTELQLWAKELKSRGIILAVCSKNTESIAREPFEKHPDMELRPDDIALFVANWENKVDNIRYIQSVLQIGFDSVVFLDDNPFEREMVKQGIPQITVPDLPEDPAEYVNYLRFLNLFETSSFTEEDLQRTKQYQEEAKRTVFQKSFANEDEYLQNLAMQAVVSPFTSFSVPRVAQLTQRSNQFNLRTQRYAEEDIKRMMTHPDYVHFTITLSDKFGDHGLICVIILKKQDEKTLFVDTWIMSCRVLKRGVENLVVNTMVQAARTGGFSRIVGEYIPTAKNGIVKDLYSKMGFIDKGNGIFELNTLEYDEKTVFINTVDGELVK